MSSLAESIRIATRSSPLAMWQSSHVADLIRESVPGCDVELIPVSTQGDQDRSSTLASMGGQGVFTREVQAAVLDGRADIAVHSLKDLPTTSVDGLTLAAVPRRASPLDALILNDEEEEENDETLSAGATAESLLAGLPNGAKIGTGSPRRKAQLLHCRSDLKVEPIRGNVETRLAKLDAGEFDAIILAEAGLARLGFQERISMLLRPPVMYGAVGQGAIGIECRAEDEMTMNTLARISNAEDFSATAAERSLMRTLQAGCHAPVGTRTLRTEKGIKLYGVVLSLDGSVRIVAKETGDPSRPDELGAGVASLLCRQGAETLLAPYE